MQVSKNITNQNSSVQPEGGCVTCFSALGIPSRMHIYKFLRHKKKATVNEIVEEVKLTQPTVSYHLSEMKHAGILSATKHGKEVIYEINKDCSFYNSECVLHGIKFPAIKNYVKS